MTSKTASYGYVFRYVYAMIGIVVIGAAGIIVALISAQQTDRDARDRITAFHIRSTSIVEQLRRENQFLSEELMLLEPIDDIHLPAGVEHLHPDLNARLRTMSILVDRLKNLQSLYGDIAFEGTLTRIDDRLDTIIALMAADDARARQFAAVSMLDLALNQFYRQHSIAEDILLSRIEMSSERQMPLLMTVFAILMFSGLAAWVAIRMLKSSIERRVSAEEALAQSQQRIYQMQKLEALGLLVGGVAHDFNNLLTAILGQAGLVLDTEDCDGDVRDSLEEIIEAATQASNLTRQLLAFSRPEAQELRVLNLGDVVLSMTGMLRRLLGENVVLQVHAEPGLQAVEVDPTQIRQVILNLAINARDAMPRGGTLTVTVDNLAVEQNDRAANVPKGDYVRMLVADTGVGMDEETQQRLFEPFYTTKAKARGTGLGLSTVHGIVTAADGHILVTSRPGMGSVFELRLPATQKQVESSEPEEPSHEEVAGTETVLVVEDERQIRKFISSGLATLGYHVISAPSAAAGIEVCEKEHDGIDVIVSDVIMPGMNGADFVYEALKLHPDAVALFISGYAGDVLADSGVEELDIPMLQKPFDIRTLASLIRTELGGRDET
ncbi:MAG: ATP-binding protein [Woeseiaceae bacterium]|nr:ATP-binding protein [Woeseiaceae bacterium]